MKNLGNKIKYIITTRNKCFFYQENTFLNKIKKSLLFFLLICFSIIVSLKKIKKIKIAICTMARKENLYIQEFIQYYINLGFDHIFIYDDNDPNTEKISFVLNSKYQNFVTINENINNEMRTQSGIYNHCYMNNNKKFDWLLMIDIDEFLYISNYNLKNYLTKSIFNKCDFIKFNWVLPTDNDKIYYENKTLFERFKGPYIKSVWVKSIIRGNIPNLKYMVHSPINSPEKNTTCNSIGKKLYYKTMNFEFINEINIKQAYIIHFKYKSTEEYINKCKRGHHLWKGERALKELKIKVFEYLKDNKITMEKLEFFEKELNINLQEYKNKIKKQYYLN